MSGFKVAVSRLESEVDKAWEEFDEHWAEEKRCGNGRMMGERTRLM